MNLQLISGPAQEPLDLPTVKLWARLDGDAFDPILPMMITAARQVAEHELGAKLITQTYRVESLGWPGACDLVPLFPVQSVTASYWNGTSWAALDSAAIVAVRDGFSASIQLAAGAAPYPALGLHTGARVRIDLAVGYGDAPEDVPNAIRQFIAAHVAYWARNPEAAQEAKYQMLASPFLSALLDPFRTYL